MRHRKKPKKESTRRGRDSAILKNQAVSFILHEKIKTTSVRAKLLKSFVEKLITSAKKQDLSARKEVYTYLPKRGAVVKLFEEIAPRYKERNGGYTRIIKVGMRKGDGAEISQIELI